jgi:hypothetical protein
VVGVAVVAVVSSPPPAVVVGRANVVEVVVEPSAIEELVVVPKTSSISRGEKSCSQGMPSPSESSRAGLPDASK